MGNELLADVPEPDDRLNGWKEISAFLGKGVRTVQRWEKEYKLPVRRLGRIGGEIIWASRRELDGWQRVQSATLWDADPTPPTGTRIEMLEKPALGAPASPTLAAVPTLPALPVERPSERIELAVELPRRRYHWRWSLGGAVATALIMWLGAGFFAAPAGTRRPASWDLQGGYFIVFARDGAELFSKSVPALAEHVYDRANETAYGGRVAFRDLDGDGSIETLLAIASNFTPGAGLIAFDANGKERFAYYPTNVVTFGGVRYAGPWQPLHMWVVGEGATTSIFVALIGSLSFPCLLAELDTSGRIKSEYWSNGYIDSLVQVPWNGRPALFVGGTHNDSRDASLAIFSDGRLRGSGPAEKPGYRCNDCAPGVPDHFLVFPRRAIAKAYPGGEGQAAITELRVEADSKVHVQVAEGRRMSGAYLSTVWYTLDSALTPVEARPSEQLFVEHARLFAERALDHAFGGVDRLALFPVRRWNGGRFLPLPAGQVTR